MKTPNIPSQRRDSAHRVSDVQGASTRPQTPAVGIVRTCKVSIPENLHAATKLVAARRKQGLQDFVAEILRGHAEVAAEETTIAATAS